jgi:hypothetical protein
MNEFIHHQMMKTTRYQTMNLYRYKYRHHLNGRMNLLQTKKPREYYDECEETGTTWKSIR